MTDYLFTNFLITLSVLWALRILKSGPASINLMLLVAAILCWFVPWQMIPIYTITSVPDALIFSVADILPLSKSVPVIDVSSGSIPDATSTALSIPPFEVLLSGLFVAVLLIGGVVFTLRIYAYQKLIKRLYRHSSPTTKYSDMSEGYPVRITSLGTPAIASGLLRPLIWLDRSMQERSELTSILRHEANHLRLGDIYWAWLLCLFESLFWWNPLCKALSKQAKEQLELRCDERCFAILNQQYQRDLASLLLVQHNNNLQPTFTAPMLSMAHQNSFNIKRIKMLDKEKTVKTKHIIALVLSISCSAAAATKIVGNESPTQPVSQQQIDSSYDAQMSDLLAGASNAKSEDIDLLNETFENILDWHSSRKMLNSHSEMKIKLQGFTLLSHIGHKLGRYEDVLSAYEEWYPQTDTAPFFLKNVTAITHLRLGQPEQALEDLLALKAILKDRTKTGSLMLMARAYVDMKDYANAQKILDQLPGNDDLANALKYYVYFHQNDTANMASVKAQLPAEFDSLPPTLPDLGIPLSPLLEKL